MTKKPILLLGAGGHARASIDVIEQEGQFAIGGLIGVPEEVGGEIFGYPVLGTDADLPALRHQYDFALVTIGHIKTPQFRIRFFDALIREGYELPIIVSPHAYVSPRATLGAGTMVLHGAIINAGVRIGRNCIINSQALVEHDVMIADHCHISTAAAVNSGVSIGAGTFIGSNASVRQCLTIGENSLIGMGQRVLADCAAGSQLPAIKELT
ncbi:MAG: acetyltransferase [Legionella sp.]|nr:acetyltransferase [Legionella sp.]